ncbi:MAG TPA: diacylglycerol kinase family protein [Segetibacter sp.]|jgi:diacylglycerol kinase
MANFLRHIGYASEGIIYFFKNERNGRIQAVFAVLTIGAGFYFTISKIEWCIVLGSIGLVISLELVNTAIERMCEMLSKEYHPMIKIIKDVAAGAVWWFAIFAAIIGIVIFAPYLWNSIS